MPTAVLLDIDGVLTVSWEPLPGAVEALAWLRERQIPVRLVTNTSSRTRHDIVRLLDDAGMPVQEDAISTAVTSAARYLAEHHPNARVLVLNEGDGMADLDGVEQIDRAEDAGVVLLGGAGPAVSYQRLNAAFRLAADGTPVVALHRNTRFQTADGVALDMGAFIAGMEAAADIDLTLVGKPTAGFFRAAVEDLGADPGDTVMVGDDIDADVRGGQAAGLTGVLVRTGKFRGSDLDTEGAAPDHVIDGIADLPELLEGL